MKDDISIAFTKSNYYPSYGDQGIPGSRPADLRAFFGRKLGRHYAPVPLNAGCLNNALIATGPLTPLGPIPTLPEIFQRPQKRCQREFNEALREQKGMKDEEVQGIVTKSTGERPCLIGVKNYIFNTRNGGRRHYSSDTSFHVESSPEGRGATDQGSPIPKKGPMPPPGGASTSHLCPLPGCFGTRKGRGVYNFDTSCPSRPAQEALVERERERVQAEAGRALVAKPLDHSLIELGLWSLIYPTGLTPPKVSPPRDGDGGGAAGASCVIDICEGSASVQLNTDAVDAKKEILDGKNTDISHTHPEKNCTFISAAYKREDKDSAAAAFHQARRTIEKARMTRKTKAAARLLHEDIKLVQSLAP